MKKCVMAGLLLALAPVVAAEENLKVAQDLAACVPLFQHSEMQLRQAGHEREADFYEGMSRGAVIASLQALENGGYDEGYAQGAIPAWVETNAVVFRLSVADEGFFEQEINRCGALNATQTKLVDQWRKGQRRG